ncbi:MAG: pyridoxamine 5'-phosphate oxidase family protein [Acidimicrobiales bacterium]
MGDAPAPGFSAGQVGSPSEPRRTAPGEHPERLVMDPLSLRASWRYLQSTNMGRLALTSGALPVIVPVTYVVVDDAIVFRAGSHDALSPSSAGAVVAFEAGELRVATGDGWTVLVRGIIHQLTSPDPRIGDTDPKQPDDVLLALRARIVEGSRVRIA